MNSDWVKVVLLMGSSIAVSVVITVFLLGEHEKHPHRDAIPVRVFELQLTQMEQEIAQLHRQLDHLYRLQDEVKRR